MSTVSKFQDFFVTQILREINFAEFRRCNTTVFAILGALNFVNLEIAPFKKCKNKLKF